MKKLDSFKSEKIDNLENIKGGLQNTTGGFVHTSLVMLGVSFLDVYYDSNGNGKYDEGESSLIGLANDN